MELTEAEPLRVSPGPLTPARRTLLLVSSLLVAVTRLLAPARSPWDWDEMLFALAVDDYDVARHHPHPPGFPVFIAMAKLLHGMGLSEFRSLQTITLIASVLLLPVMFAFARELRFSFETSLSAAVLLSFFPNVWFFGETAFSDVPSLTLVLAACTLLLRGRRETSAYIGGAFVLALAIGVRPQNLIIALAPGLIATWCQIRQRRWGVVIAVAIGGAALVVLAYGLAAWASGGLEQYIASVSKHEAYIRSVDSIFSPTRPRLYRVLDDFLLRPFRAGAINIVLAGLAALSVCVSLMLRRRHVLLAVATFGPFTVVALLMLDWLSASRFSIAYAPLMAILGADGIAIVASAAPTHAMRRVLTASAVAAIALTMIFWALPAITLSARQLSPPIQAMTWIRENLDPKTTTIYVGSLGPHAAYFLRDYRLETVAGKERIAPAPQSWFLKEGLATTPGTRTFRWPRDPLWKIARRRYFEVSVVPVR